MKTIINFFTLMCVWIFALPVGVYLLVWICMHAQLLVALFGLAVIGFIIITPFIK